MLTNIINNLKKTKDLGNIYVLDNKLKSRISKLEDKNNIGVHECLKRKNTIMLTHDSRFRSPEGEIVLKDKKGILFPGVPFSEVKAVNVISSSPSKKIHALLMKKFKLKLKDEATLLIGFD